MRNLFSLLLTAALLCSVSVFAAETEPETSVFSIDETSVNADAQDISSTDEPAGEMTEDGEWKDDVLSEERESANISEDTLAGDGKESEKEPVDDSADEMLKPEMSAPFAADIMIPKTGHIILNPYRMPLEINGTTYQEQVISEENIIVSSESRSLIMSIEATGTLAEESTVEFVSSPQDLSDDAKTLFVWFEFQILSHVDDKPEWTGKYEGTENQVAVNGDTVSLLTLPVAAGDELVYVAFRAFGYATTPLGMLWEEKDQADFSIAFTFMPEFTDNEELSDVVDEVSDVEEAVDVADEVSGVEEAVDVVDEVSGVEEAVDVADEASDVEEPVDVVDDASNVEEAVDVADDASGVEEGVDVADEASDVEEPVDIADEASDVEEPVDVVDEASDVEEPVDVVDDASGVEEAVDVADDASDVEEPVDVADEASNVEEAVDDVDDVSDVVQPTIGEPPKPIDIDEASDLVQPTIGEPPIPMDVDEASGVEEPVDVVDEASDVEEPVDVADEASDVEESVDDVDEASDVEESADDVDEVSETN